MFRSFNYALPLAGVMLVAALGFSAIPTATLSQPTQFKVADDQSGSWFSPLHYHHWLRSAGTSIG